MLLIQVTTSESMTGNTENKPETKEIQNKPLKKQVNSYVRLYTYIQAYTLVIKINTQYQQNSYF